MADLSITAANVALGSAKGATTEVVQVATGVTITRGQPYYKDSAAGNKAKLGDATDSNAKVVAGIALTGTSADGFFVGLKSGTFTPGATLVKGDAYFLSDTAGGIKPEADLSSGDNIVQLFRATSTSEAVLAIDDTGIEL